MRNQLSLGVALLAAAMLLGTWACAPEGDAPDVAAEAGEAAGAEGEAVMATEVDVVETDEGMAVHEVDVMATEEGLEIRETDIVVTEEGAVGREIDTIATEEGVLQVETDVVMDATGEVIAEETSASFEPAPVSAGMEEEDEKD